MAAAGRWPQTSEIGRGLGVVVDQQPVVSLAKGIEEHLDLLLQA
jgi:hypothetical protein